jgi:PAS domain S-box-containing protein
MQNTQESSSYDRLLGDVSSRLMRAATRKVDAAIRRSVAAIGKHYDVDRIDIRRFSEDRSASILLSGWTSSDDIGVATDLQNEEAPWASSLVLRGQVVRIRSLDDMPPSSAGAGRIMMQEDGLNAALLIPLEVDDEPYGAIVLCSKNDRDWSDETVSEVRTLGELIAIAHSRAKLLSKLWTSETRLRAVVEEQTEFVVRFLPDGTQTWVNDAFCAYLQQPREKLIGSSFMKLTAPDSYEELAENISRISPDAPTRTNEIQFTDPSGKASWHRWTTKGIFNLNGDLVELQSLGRDITDRKAAENALLQSESRHRGLVENISDWIWEMDLDRNVVYSNANVENLLGYTVEEVRQLNAADILHPESLQAGLSLLKNQSANPVGWDQLLMQFRHKDGGYRIMQSNARPKFDDKGALVGFRGIDRDVTEAVISQEEILRRSEFQRQLTDLSTLLLTAPIEKTRQLVDEELQRICERYDLYSGSIWAVVGGGTERVERRAGWRDTNKISKSRVDRNLRYEVPWFLTNVLNDEVIRVNHLDDIPADGAADRAAFEKIGIASLVAFAATATSELSGYCVFSSTEPRQWDDTTVQELNLIANTLTAVCARAWAAEDILRSQQDLIRSQAVASLGSYTIKFDPPTAEFTLDVEVERSPQHYVLHGVEEREEAVDEILGRIHPDDYERVMSVMQNAFGSEEGIRQTYRLVRPDKSVIHIESRVEFDLDDRGRVVRAIGIDYDVTEQVNARQKLESALAEIKKLRDQLQQENIFLRDEIRVAHGFDQIIGSGPKLKRALTLAEKVAPTGVSVLILGETGTGKELVAQSIHDMSDRKNKAMISVNCAALSKDLIESELFGHEKGAFTGAHERRKGRFELADGGTLFLDEIGELSADLQAKLLRVLQSGDFVRLGGTETLNVDVRIVAATNKNLRRAVDDGEFRADLFYRIGTFPIELPPLRERREDIPALVEFLVQKHAERMGKEIHSISARTIRHLSQQQWSGNVRELESVLQRALISTPGQTLDYVEEIGSIPAAAASTSVANATTDLQDVQRQHIIAMLNASDWVIDGKNGAAALMGIAASTLRSKMKRLDIQRPS